MGAADIKKPFIFAVCGRKNSGKTTLIVEIVKFFTEKHFRVAVIKHDGHDFTCDVPGTDSDRFAKAGAKSVAVYSRERIFVHQREKAQEEEKLQLLINTFKDADLIVIEGAKNSSLPKVELLGRDKEAMPVSNSQGRRFLISDNPEKNYGEKVISSKETDVILKTLYAMFKDKEEESYV